MRILFILSVFTVFGINGMTAQTIRYSDDLSSDLAQWIVEKTSDKTTVQIKESLLDVVAPGGVTLWYTHKLEGDVLISFEARVIDEGGNWDRVSDLNCFWMANDPEHPDDFFARSDWRNGTFGKYYSLSLYYVGYGGNTNSTTRFRKYTGDYRSFAENQERPGILKEYTDPPHLIIPNQWYSIQIKVSGAQICYTVNDEVLFDYTDQDPYRSGYFGLRTVKNHIQYRNFKVFELQEN